MLTFACTGNFKLSEVMTNEIKERELEANVDESTNCQ